jgi:peroxiredoxin
MMALLLLSTGCGVGSGLSPGNRALEFSAMDLEGTQINLSEYRGKVVLLDFWATWCPGCVIQMPHLKSLYDKYHGDGFEIIGISADTDLQVLKEYVRRAGIQWPQILDPARKETRIAELYRAYLLPTTYLIDRDGVIRAVNLSGKELDSAVKALLGSSTRET